MLPTHLLSSVLTSTDVPHSAWCMGMVTLCTRSDPRREKRGCGRALRTNTTGPGSFLGVLLPSLHVHTAAAGGELADAKTAFLVALLGS